MAGLCSVMIQLLWAVIIGLTEYPSHAEVVGFLGSSITLQFTFNGSINENSIIGVYITGEKKIDEYKNKEGKRKSSFNIYPQNSSIFYHITNLTLNQSNVYWASLFGSTGIPVKSNEVQLIIQEENRSTTDNSAVITVVRVFAIIIPLSLVVAVYKICVLKCINSRS